MSTEAKHIVEILLEDANVPVACSACQKEFGVRPGPNDSHSYCKRHLIQMYQHTMSMSPPDRHKAVEHKIAEIQARPDNTFPPDLAHQRQAGVA
jgi:hypothetical protein